MIEHQKPLGVETEYTAHARFILQQIARQFDLPAHIVNGDPAGQNHAQSRVVDAPAEQMFSTLQNRIREIK